MKNLCFYGGVFLLALYCAVETVPLYLYPNSVRHFRNFGLDPEANMNASQLITSKGYPCEEYDVITEDGYILTIQRIPYGRGQKPGPREVVFLQHGLLGTSTNFLTNLVNESFAYILADQGFDVWLGNVRGCTYGRRHVKLNVKDVEFWDFSWDEMALKDLPAMISQALKISNVKQLNYVGFSQGTMIGYAGFSRNQTLGKQIKSFMALGPVSTLKYIGSPLKYFAPIVKERTLVDWLIDLGEFLPSDGVMKWIGKHACLSELSYVCADFLFLIAGQDAKQLNKTRLPVYLTHTPGGTSWKNIIHYGQAVLNGKFQMFDYGSAEKNIAKYGTNTPPVYNPADMNVPAGLFWGGRDLLADPGDVNVLLPQLKKVIANVPVPSFEHLDFIWAVNATGFVYMKIIDFYKLM
ncbi:gastric triacylglycerol lipase-like [Tubulanus polymorphus]|uniref:gastric triacylglycerol lipase-like n=1 Tax=Tubulanus polymorphus TaxID=672921 RepID=UPI003DA67C4C